MFILIGMVAWFSVMYYMAHLPVVGMTESSRRQESFLDGAPAGPAEVQQALEEGAARDFQRQSAADEVPQRRVLGRARLSYSMGKLRFPS